MYKYVWLHYARLSYLNSFYCSGSTKEEMTDSLHPVEAAELSLRQHGRKSIGESYAVHGLTFRGKSLEVLSLG